MSAFRTKALNTAETARTAELERLWAAEFGTPNELVIRYGLIGVGSIAAFIYTGLAYPLIWGVTYFLTQWIMHLVLKRWTTPSHRMQAGLGVLTYILTTGTFVSMPLGLMVFTDGALAYCGAMALLSLCAFSLWRPEPPPLVLYYDIVLAWIFAAAAAYVAWPTSEIWLGKIMMVLMSAALALYYSLALTATRRNRSALREASARATEAMKMEAIGRLSGGVAHDFNNILTVLQGNLELYEEIDDPEERRKLIDDAMVATRRASGVVRQLLTFARRAPLEPSLINVTDVIEELTSLTARLLPATMRVFAATPSKPVFVRADRDQLLSSLLNLVINARDAIAGHGELTLAAVETAVTDKRPVEGLEAGHYIAFSVSDTGPGMTPETLAQALEPFFTTKPVGEGSGLGLPTANGFAQQSGGTLDIDTGPKGTKITIFLPRLTDAQALL